MARHVHDADEDIYIICFYFFVSSVYGLFEDMFCSLLSFLLLALFFLIVGTLTSTCNQLLLLQTAVVVIITSLISFSLIVTCCEWRSFYQNQM